MFRPGLLRFFRLFLPRMTWEIDDPQAVYLTIDDGPTPGITEWILDELRRHDVKATFFCLGRNVDMYPELYEKIIAEGHKVGNHSYSHLKGWETSPEEYLGDVELANQLVNSDIFRPPYGRITRRQARLLSRDYRLVMGDIVSQDYSRAVHPRQCLRNVTRHVKPGSVIVFHDSVKSFPNTQYALPHAIEHIKRMGLEFKTVEGKTKK